MNFCPQRHRQTDRIRETLIYLLRMLCILIRLSDLLRPGDIKDEVNLKIDRRHAGQMLVVRRTHHGVLTEFLSCVLKLTEFSF